MKSKLRKIISRYTILNSRKLSSSSSTSSSPIVDTTTITNVASSSIDSRKCDNDNDDDEDDDENDDENDDDNDEEDDNDNDEDENDNEKSIINDNYVLQLQSVNVLDSSSSSSSSTTTTTSIISSTQTMDKIEIEEWFFDNIDRRTATQLLLGDDTLPVGTFLVRYCEQPLSSSSSSPSSKLQHSTNGYSLSIRYYDRPLAQYRVKHYRIFVNNSLAQQQQQQKRNNIEETFFYINSERIFSSLSTLIDYYRTGSHGLCSCLAKVCPKQKNFFKSSSPNRHHRNHQRLSFPSLPQPSLQSSTMLYNEKIDPNELEIGKLLGEGYFGQVYRGIYRHTQLVAIKKMKSSRIKEIGNNLQDFINEAAIMRCYSHQALVTFFGVAMSTNYADNNNGVGDMMIVTEYMSNGSLKDFLRKNCAKICTIHLLNMAMQIASGMVYLERKSMLHRDLAARNVLVSKNGQVVKVADFGMAREIQGSEYYLSQFGQFAYRWAALEVLRELKFFPKSDVWSFGVLLYEMCTKGGEPYATWSVTPPNSSSSSSLCEKILSTQSATISFVQLTEKLSKGLRLKNPQITVEDAACSKQMYEVMCQCWHETVDQRPSFKQLYYYFDEYYVAIRTGRCTVDNFEKKIKI